MEDDEVEQIILTEEELKRIDEICKNPPDVSEFLKDYIYKMNEAYPFKRIVAPQHLIDRWNEEIGKQKGETVEEMAFTIDKNAIVSDEEIWKMMTYTATLSEKENNPPHTGMEKRKLI